MSQSVRQLAAVDAERVRAGRPSRAEVEAAYRTVIRWIGEDPNRDGLKETPARVVRALDEFFAGYRQDPFEILQKTFEETEGYDEMIVFARRALREPLRTPLGADHRAGVGRLRAEWPGGRDQQARAHR